MAVSQIGTADGKLQRFARRGRLWRSIAVDHYHMLEGVSLTGSDYDLYCEVTLEVQS